MPRNSDSQLSSLSISESLTELPALSARLSARIGGEFNIPGDPLSNSPRTRATNNSRPKRQRKDAALSSPVLDEQEAQSESSHEISESVSNDITSDAAVNSNNLLSSSRLRSSRKRPKITVVSKDQKPNSRRRGDSNSELSPKEKNNNIPSIAMPAIQKIVAIQERTSSDLLIHSVDDVKKSVVEEISPKPSDDALKVRKIDTVLAITCRLKLSDLEKEYVQLEKGTKLRFSLIV